MSSGAHPPFPPPVDHLPVQPATPNRGVPLPVWSHAAMVGNPTLNPGVNRNADIRHLPNIVSRQQDTVRWEGVGGHGMTPTIV